MASPSVKSGADCRCESGPGRLRVPVAMPPCVVETPGAKRGGCDWPVCSV